MSVVGRLGQDGLVEALQAARLVARHGHHAGQGDEDEEERIGADERDDERQEHQRAAEAQDPPTSDAVAEDGDAQGQERGPDERSREDRPDLTRAQAELDEVDAQDDRPEPEPERPDRLAHEHEATVPIERWHREATRGSGAATRDRHVRTVVVRQSSRLAWSPLLVWADQRLAGPLAAGTSRLESRRPSSAHRRPCVYGRTQGLIHPRSASPR